MTMLVWLLRVAVAAAGAWLLCVLLISMFQEKLIFHPQPLLPGSAEAMKGFEEVKRVMRDGTVLHGWFVPGRGERAGAVIYFGGNAEEVSGLAREQARFGGHALVLINYRGYGNSGGRPGEQEFFSDALEIYDWVRARAEVDHGRLFVMGRSLGSGVAVHLAAHRPLRGVLLVSPYDALSEMAKDAYPWVPVRWVLRHRFDSMSKAPGIKIPAAILFGTEDQTIPPARTRKLASVWGGKVTLREIPGADHNSLDLRPEYWETMEGFFRGP